MGGGSANGGAGGASGGMGGMNSSTSSNSSSSTGAGGDGVTGPGRDTWGLPTGGGGCTCSVGESDRRSGIAAIFAMGALAAGYRRRNRRSA